MTQQKTSRHAVLSPQQKHGCKGLFVTATGTDMGKTYITALLVRALRQAGLNAGYYKAALSGAETIAESDAGYVNRTAGIGQPQDTLLSYLYQNAVSPHLAARLEGNPPELEKIQADFCAVCARYDYVTVEGSGGIVCPLRWDEQEHLLLEQVIALLGLGTVVVADAGLGTINAVVLTVEYLRARNISVRGVILNRWAGGTMQQDNAEMIEQLTQAPVIARVAPGDTDLRMLGDSLTWLYQ
jgi:dethiobiotin synthetase